MINRKDNTRFFIKPPNGEYLDDRGSVCYYIDKCPLYKNTSHGRTYLNYYNTHWPRIQPVSTISRDPKEESAMKRYQVGIIGGTGSGKSSVVNLIPRFYDVTDGSIRLDGTDIREVTQHDLRDKLGYVPQKGLLFSGDIASNIMFGNPEGGGQEMKEAAQIAQATEFIEAKPNKYESPISQGGSNVSGGQKQRVSIARAFLKDAPIILMDEATASLDVDNETMIQESLSKLIRNKTVMIIAHRMRTVADADKIVVLKDGVVAEQGTPAELEAKDGIYRHMKATQMEAAGWKL